MEKGYQREEESMEYLKLHEESYPCLTQDVEVTSLKVRGASIIFCFQRIHQRMSHEKVSWNDTYHL